MSPLPRTICDRNSSFTRISTFYKDLFCFDFEVEIFVFSFFGCQCGRVRVCTSFVTPLDVGQVFTYTTGTPSDWSDLDRTPASGAKSLRVITPWYL
jgi:hypothetical protein